MAILNNFNCQKYKLKIDFHNLWIGFLAKYYCFKMICPSPQTADCSKINCPHEIRMEHLKHEKNCNNVKDNHMAGKQNCSNFVLWIA